MNNERIAIFGDSKGLGAAVSQSLEHNELLKISRSSTHLDLSREPDQEKALELLKKFMPDRIFYFVGGGPHGPYSEKNWRDHEWALKVNFLFPARLIHEAAKLKSLKQLIVTGSAIAESSPDPLAASYSTAKHALKALFENLQLETLSFDLRLFSPGYMDTALLPKNSWPRQSEKILDPTEVAKIFCEWANDIRASRHKILK